MFKVIDACGIIHDAYGTFIDIDGEYENVELVPGKDGVTATDIKMLHSMDDAEVYNNIKNCKPVSDGTLWEVLTAF